MLQCTVVQFMNTSAVQIILLIIIDIQLHIGKRKKSDLPSTNFKFNNMRIKLNNGLSMPIIGLGTWKSGKEEATKAVEVALKAGYRHVDCACDYDNEEYVGQGISNMIANGMVQRKNLFVTTKLWNTWHRPDDVHYAFQQSLAKLKCGYIDLFLMHFPTGEDKSVDEFPDLTDSERSVSHVDYIDTWKSMEKLLPGGLVKSIGVSNFNEYQLRRILDECDIPPAVNQIETHPYLIERSLVEFCQNHGIHITAYSPLGSSDHEWAAPEDPVLLTDPVLMEIANKLQRSTAQVLLRFNIQRNISVIPKSVMPSHIADNLEILNFQISNNDMARIFALNRDWRALDTSWINGNKYFPFVKNYIEK